VKDELKDLQENNVGVSQMVEFQSENCQEAESWAYRRRSA